MGFRKIVPTPNAVDPLGTVHIQRRHFLKMLPLFATAGLMEGCGPAVFHNVPLAANLPAQVPVTSPPGVTAPLVGSNVDSYPITATVAVLMGSRGTIGPAFCGLAYEKSKLTTPFFNSSNLPLISLLRLLGPGVLSVNGSSVDRVHWDPNGSGEVSGVVAPADIDALAGFLRAAGWQVVYGVNLAQSYPQSAADEALYAAHALGDRLLAITLGNEPDSYPGTYMPSSWGFSDFAVLWQSFADAIRSSVPGVSLAGPATAGNATWFSLFSSAPADSVSLLNHHYYRGNAASASSTSSHLINYPDSSLVSMLETIGGAAAAARLPLRVAETNSFYNGGRQGVSDAYASALWVIDQSFTLAEYSVQGFNLQGGGRGAYTPVEDDGKRISVIRPEFYGLLLFALAGQGELALLQLDRAGLNLSAYVVRSVQGGLRVVIVNKEPQTVRLAVDLGFPAQTATALRLSNTSLDSLSGTRIGEVSLLADGQFSGTPLWNAVPLSFSVGRVNTLMQLDVPAISALIIKVN